MDDSINHKRIPVTRIKLGPDTSILPALPASPQAETQPQAPSAKKPSLFIRLIALVSSSTTRGETEISARVVEFSQPDPDLERIARSFSNDELPPLMMDEEMDHPSADGLTEGKKPGL